VFNSIIKIAKDEQLDIIGGAAGCLASLLKIDNINPVVMFPKEITCS
jgi:hypothetical protein